MMNEKEDNTRKKRKLNDEGPPALANIANQHESSEAGSIVSAVTLDCLPSEVLGIIMSYGCHSDALVLRSTCKEIKKDVDVCLYKASIEKLLHPIDFDRDFCQFFSTSASIRLGGKYRNETEATEFAMERLDLTQEAKKKIMKQLSKTGHANGKTKREYWDRKFSSKQVTRIEMMRTWISFYRETTKGDQNMFMFYLDQIPKEEQETIRKTIQSVHEMNRIMFGLYVGSSDDAKFHMTAIFRDDDIPESFVDTSSDEHYFCFYGSSGGKIVVETKSTTWNCDGWA